MSKLRNQSGMTLLEVLTAVLILGIMLAPLASFFIISNQRARHNLVQRQAMAVAEAHMEWLRQERFSPVFVDREGEGEIPPVDKGKFTVYTEVEAVEVPQGKLQQQQFLTRVVVRVVWSGGEVRLSTLASPYR